MRHAVIILAIIAVPVLGHAATLKVPTKYPTIQDAIDAASGGDTVLVAPGTYMENIDFKGKAITVTGEKGPDVTVIDGGNPPDPDKGSVVTFENNEGLDSILDGLTITNGTGTKKSGFRYGGGIYAYHASPMLMNNIITLNSADWGGGGVCLMESPHGRLSHNVIVHNTSGYQGGGIYIKNGGTPVVANCLIGFNETHSDGGGCWFTDCSAVVANCLIVNNYTIYWDGAGLWCWNSPNGLVANCTILYNDADPDGWGGGIFAENNPPPITNCIVRDNIPIDIWGDQTTTYSNVGWLLPGVGCINAPPHFVDPDGPDNNPSTWEDNDFHIQYTCPCKDAGNTVPGMPGLDWEGDPRIAYGTADMGADEFYTHLYWSGDATPGGDVELKFVGLPGSTPVVLCIGTGVLDPPLKSMWGDWYLQFPIIGPMDLGSIPAPAGVLIAPGRLPATPPAPYSIPMQALIGAELSNLSVLEVK